MGAVGTMTSGDDFRKYHQLKSRIEKDIQTTMNSERYTKLRELHRRCYPTKEQVIEEVERFYEENPQ